MSRPGQLLHLLAAGVVDRLGSLLGRPPRYVPAGVASGEFGAVANEQAFGGLEIIRPNDGSVWQNRVAARSLLGIAAHRPARKAADIQCPILLVVGEDDTIAPAGPALKVAERAPKSELYRSRGGHYDVYEGGADHDNVVRVEVEFLRQHAGLPAGAPTAPNPSSSVAAATDAGTAAGAA
jgi:pimeloyl-ACP methyl ester carboxylesterase